MNIIGWLVELVGFNWIERFLHRFGEVAYLHRNIEESKKVARLLNAEDKSSQKVRKSDQIS